MIDALACSLSERKQQTLQERRGGKKRKQFYIYSENNRPGRNTHTKNKYTPVQRARVRVISFYFISLTYIYRKKYKVIDVSDQTLKIDNNAQKCIERKITRRKKIYERDWFGSHTYNRYSSLSV